MREEEVAAGLEAGIDTHAQQLSCACVELHRLAGEQTVDARAPLLSDASVLNTDAPAPMPARLNTVTNAPRSLRWKAIESPTTPAPTTNTSGPVRMPRA
jgi:hypothetical protein